MRLRRWLIAGSLVTALAACGSDPQPVSGPDDEGRIEAEGKGKGQEPATPKEEPRTNDVIKLDTFSEDVLALETNDIVMVRMTKSGGTMKGTIVSVRPRILTVTARGSSITSRFKPEEITDVKLLYRDDPTEVTFSGDAPLNDEETWLDRYADRAILGHDPA